MKNISNHSPGRGLGFAAAALAVVIGAGFAAGVRVARAANVSGLMSYRDGSPAAHRWLHYENAVTGDIYVAPTKPDGSFSADLPPGVYDLRGERGVILAGKIQVESQDVNIGHVVEPAPLDVLRPFESEGVAEGLVDSPAPATANLGGRPLGAMKYGPEAMASVAEPATPAPQSTPLAELTPGALVSPAAMLAPSGGH